MLRRGLTPLYHLARGNAQDLGHDPSLGPGQIYPDRGLGSDQGLGPKLDPGLHADAGPGLEHHADQTVIERDRDI